MKLRFFVLLLAAGCSSQTASPPDSATDVPVTADVAPVDVQNTVDASPDVIDAARDAGSGDAADVADAADAITDTITDALVDATADAATDAVTDASLDAPADAPVDAPVDAATDRAADVVDAAVDARPDLPDAAGDAAFDATTDALTDAAADANGEWMPFPGATCNARERHVALQDTFHVDPDAGPIVYLTNPPASGPHFPEWTHWGAWPNVPRGHWVHNLEHGGVVYLYRCPTGTCDATRDAIVTAVNAMPTDPACMPSVAEPARLRVVVTNDNEITTPIAAAAWTWLYAADCVDAASMREFYRRHAGMATEDFCIDGSYP